MLAKEADLKDAGVLLEKTVLGNDSKKNSFIKSGNSPDFL